MTQRTIFSSVVALLLTFGSAIALGAQPPSPGATPPVDVERIGPQVGQPLPDFSLSDQEGRTRSLKSLLGPKGAVIVFFRSADW